MLLFLLIAPAVQAVATYMLGKLVPGFNPGVSPVRWENYLKISACFGEQGSLTTEIQT